MTIPVATLLLVASILLNIPIFRDIITFAYLSFVPGFVILKLFKLKELSLLYTFLISVGLSLTTSMCVGLLVNELYSILGLSQPLSIIPLTAAISTFTLIVFFIGYRFDSSTNLVSLDEILKALRSYLPLSLVLIILPILGIVGGLYVNVPIMILLSLIIAVLCVLGIASKNLIPSKFYPFLILSISISIILINLLISKYIKGGDDNVEFYLFKITQLRGHWGPINADVNSYAALFYDSMLSVTLLPTVYSVLMNLQNEMLFKILYPFIFSLVPVTLYGIYKNETGKLIGLLSTLFFVFTANAFFGELITVNRQIVAEFFLVLSVFLCLDKTIPTKEKRILLVIFGVSIAISHYAIAIIYLVFISLVVIISTVKSKIDNVFNASVILATFGLTFLWYAFSTGSILVSIIQRIQIAFADLTNNQRLPSSGVASSMYSIPKAFTTATWINLVVSGVVTFSLLLGILVIILLSRRIKISDNYKLITTFAAVIFAVSYLLPGVAATLNFTRFYAITLLFLSPCIVIGALTLLRSSSLLKIIQNKLRKRGENQKSNVVFLNNHGKTALLLVAVLLSAYFLSQSGFVNYVTGGEIHFTTFDYYKMKASSNPQVQFEISETYVQDQDAFSAVWLSKYANTLSIVYADDASRYNVLTTKGLIPGNLILSLTNTTKPEQGSFVYLNSLNIVEGIIPISTVQFNTSDISSNLNESDLIYSNGNSEILTPPGSG